MLKLFCALVALVVASPCAGQVVLIGDSTTYCKDATFDQGDVAEQILAVAPSASTYDGATVENFAIGGSSTVHWMDAHTEPHCTQFAYVQQGVDCENTDNFLEALDDAYPSPDAVVVVIGLNDWAYFGENETEPGWDDAIDDTVTNIEAIVSHFGATPVYVGTPHKIDDFWAVNLQAWSEDLGAALWTAEVAAFDFPALPLKGDGIHLNDTGCVMAGARIAEFLSTQ